MKKLFFLYEISFFLLNSCDKPICYNKSIGCWSDENESYYIYINEDIDFYCLNGASAIGIAKQDNIQGDRFRLWGYPYYLQKKGDGLNQSFDLFVGRIQHNVFGLYCDDNQKDKNRFNTYVIVDNYDEITKDTKELYCKLEYRKYINDFKWTYMVLDSTRAIFKRVN